MNYDKINEFIGQFLRSPSLKSASPGEKEEAVFTIIQNKEAILRQTFASPDYYPEMKWEAVKAEIFKTLEKQIIELLQPGLKEIIYKNIQCLIDCRKPDTVYRDMLFGLVSKLIARAHTRRTYSKILSFMSSGLVTGFLYSVYENKRSIYRGLVREESGSLKTPETAIDHLMTSVMLLPVYEITLPSRIIMSGDTANTSVGLQDIEHNSILSNSFVSKIKDIILKEIPEFSTDYIDKLSGSFYLDEDVEPPFISQFLKVIYRLAVEYRAGKKDKGADSFTLSWFNLARVNYKFFGYDYNIIDELYKISLEEDF